LSKQKRIISPGTLSFAAAVVDDADKVRLFAFTTKHKAAGGKNIASVLTIYVMYSYYVNNIY